MRRLHIRLWHAPYNGGWVWFDRRNLWRFQIGWGDLRKPEVNASFWWAILGFSGTFIIQSWPWRRPK